MKLNFTGDSAKREIYCRAEKEEPPAEEVADEEPPKDEFLASLQEELKEIESRYKKTAHEIAEMFVKVSGDTEAIRKFYDGGDVVMWSYLEDLALTKPEDSMEFRCLLDTKGRAEIEKRKAFLLKSEA